MSSLVLNFFCALIQPLDQAAKYYAEQGIPFPRTVLSEEDRKHLKECYLFEDAESSRAPILLYFPLVCDTFQKYKAPGKLTLVVTHLLKRAWPAYLLNALHILI